VYTAVDQDPLSRIGPSSIGNRRSGQVDDGISAFKAFLPGTEIAAVPFNGRDGSSHHL
jgi:hypothetical protein